MSWLVWALALAVCVAWVQRYYQAPAGPPWFGKTLRATTCALVLLVAREWVAIRLRRPQPPEATTPEQLKDRDTDD